MRLHANLLSIRQHLHSSTPQSMDFTADLLCSFPFPAPYFYSPFTLVEELCIILTSIQYPLSALAFLPLNQPPIIVFRSTQVLQWCFFYTVNRLKSSLKKIGATKIKSYRCEGRDKSLSTWMSVKC